MRNFCAARSGVVFFDCCYECSLSTADLVVFWLGLAPFSLLVLRLSALGRNENLAGGFAGRRLWVLVAKLRGIRGK